MNLIIVGTVFLTGFLGGIVAFLVTPPTQSVDKELRKKLRHTGLIEETPKRGVINNYKGLLKDFQTLRENVKNNKTGIRKLMYTIEDTRSTVNLLHQRVDSNKHPEVNKKLDCLLDYLDLEINKIEEHLEVAKKEED